MPYSEFEAWRQFFVLYPFDDYNRLYRPAAMIAATMGGGLHDRLRWLQPEVGGADLTDADMATMAAFGYTRKGEG